MSSSSAGNQISLKIITAVKEHPVLYAAEVKGNTVKLQEFKQKVWKRIADELGLDPGWVKLRWKNLRDTYARIVKSKSLRKRKWIFEDQLKFLKLPCEKDYVPQIVELSDDYIKDMNSVVVSSDDLLEQLDREEDDYNEYLEIIDAPQDSTDDADSYELKKCTVLQSTDLEKTNENLTDIEKQLAIDAYAMEIQSKYRKIMPKTTAPIHQNVLSQSNINITNLATITPLIITGSNLIPMENAVEEETLQILPTKRKSVKRKKIINQHSDIDEFFTQIGETVKKLPLKIQADIKMEVCRIVSESEFQYSEKKLNTKKYSNMPGMIPKMMLVPCHLIDNQFRNRTTEGK